MCLCANKCGGKCKDAGLFLLRLSLAIIFIFAGYSKLGSGHDMTVQMFQGMGFGAPEFWTYFVGLAELVGGLMLLLGTYVSYAATWLAIIMIVAMLTALRGSSLMNLFGPIAILGGCFALMGTGSGKWAVMKEKSWGLKADCEGKCEGKNENESCCKDKKME